MVYYPILIFFHGGWILDKNRELCKLALYHNYNNEEQKALKRQTQKKFNYRCFKCRSKNTTLDHHIPISKGGLNVTHNLVALCHPCNDKKDNFLPQEFYSKSELLELSNRYFIRNEPIIDPERFEEYIQAFVSIASPELKRVRDMLLDTQFKDIEEILLRSVSGAKDENSKDYMYHSKTLREKFAIKEEDLKVVDLYFYFKEQYRQENNISKKELNKRFSQKVLLRILGKKPKNLSELCQIRGVREDFVRFCGLDILFMTHESFSGDYLKSREEYLFASFRAIKKHIPDYKLIKPKISEINQLVSFEVEDLKKLGFSEKSADKLKSKLEDFNKKYREEYISRVVKDIKLINNPYFKS